MWARALRSAGWWFASGLLGLVLAYLAASFAPVTQAQRGLIVIAVIWTLGCAMAVVVKHAELTGWFFRRSAARLYYTSMRPFLKDAKAAVARWWGEPENQAAETGRYRNLYSQRFYHRLQALALETEKRSEVYPPPASLLHPATVEDMERNGEWVWSLTRCRAWSR
jgi:hypothetical protein